MEQFVLADLSGSEEQDHAGEFFLPGWRPFSNPRIFEKYGRQKGWERGNGLPATEEKRSDGFIELTEAEARKMEFPF